jgi:hypothetical protein
MLQGPLSRLVTVATVNAADGFDGAGAFVCPANAGFAHPAWPSTRSPNVTAIAAVTRIKSRTFMSSPIPNL